MKKLSFLFIAGSLTAQAQSTWTFIPHTEAQQTGERVIVPQVYRVARINNDFKDYLFTAPHENQVALQESRFTISLPLPDGTIEDFRVVESPVMAPELGEKFPHIKTFNVQGIEHPGVYGKLDWTDFGFHAMVRYAGNDFFIDPYCRNNTSDYVVYYTKDFKKPEGYVFNETRVPGAGNAIETTTPSSTRSERSGVCVGTQLRTYRLAVACTGEYAIAATGVSSPSTSQILSAVTTTVNRVDGVYETEVAIKLELIANDTLLLFSDPFTDPFSGNNDGGILIGESQDVIDNIIGDPNYDIGHTFSTGGGGLAVLECVCKSNIKAMGITGGSMPVGDPYDIDYVAHEVGHQFGGNHTFAAETGACDGNGNPSTAYEPGSGVTIMAYAGICGSNDLAPHSIAYFHCISFQEIVAYSTGPIGGFCPVTTATGNHAPVVSAPSMVTVPKNTPFVLTGSAIDADGDVLTYQWEEIDLGSFGDWNSSFAPYFRSYAPVSTPERMFPRLDVVLSGDYTGTKGEYLTPDPQILTFRFNVRDNRMGGGGLCSTTTDVQIDNSGPFEVTYPSAAGITWYSGGDYTVTWDVNATNASPINCSLVNILISTDGGNTFTTLLANTPNDGSQLITAPIVAVTENDCRIKVQSVGNIFFDISNNNFTLSSTLAGVDELSNNVHLQVVPNPFTNDIQLSFSGLAANEKTTLTLYDVLGQVVLTDVFEGAEEVNKKYDLSSLEKGVYFIEVANHSQKQVTRLVKQ